MGWVGQMASMLFSLEILTLYSIQKGLLLRGVTWDQWRKKGGNKKVATLKDEQQ